MIHTALTKPDGSPIARPAGFSLLELTAVSVILGLVSVLILPRLTNNNDAAKTAACHVFKGDIEIQAELWIHNTGSWPAANLSDIGADLNYFPEGIPICPVDGSAYTINASTGLVVGHTH